MSRDELFELYAKVQRKDHSAEDKLIAEHKKKFPNNWFHTGGYDRGTDPYYRETMHMMYLHLSK